MTAVQYCQSCGQLRPESELVHLKVDRGAEIDEPPGTVFAHVWYCPDKPDCVRRKDSLTTLGWPWAGVIRT